MAVSEIVLLLCVFVCLFLDHFVELEFVQHLVSLIEQVRVQSNKEFVLEALAIALRSLVNNNEKALEILRSSNLKDGLQEIVSSTTGNEAYLVRNVFVHS